MFVKKFVKWGESQKSDNLNHGCVAVVDNLCY